MTKTSWSRCSSLLLAVVLIASLATPAAAVSVADQSVAEEAEVGEQITATVTLEELYRNPEISEWDLAGETNLTNVTWTVYYYDQTGALVTQESYDGQSFRGATVRADDGVSEVEVRIEGTVPEVESYTYDPPQEFTLMELAQTREGGATNDIDTWTAHHYTADSDAARSAMDEARATIDATDADTSEAEDDFDKAVDAYESGNFDLATTLANDAQEKAEASQESSERRQLLLYAAVGLVVIGLVVGGVYVYRSRQQTYDRLG